MTPKSKLAQNSMRGKILNVYTEISDLKVENISTQ